MTTIIRDGSAAGHIPELPSFRAVSPEVFAERAGRFDAIAVAHPFEAYLRFAAALSRAQHQALAQLGDVPIPDETTLAQCREHGLPPLSIDGHRRNPAWRDALAQLLHLVERNALPESAHDIVECLRKTAEDPLEGAAAALLAGAYNELDPAQAPFIGAALQLYWVKMALQLGATAIASPPQIGLCPVCGSHPMASVVRIGGSEQGLRYLVCPLCCSEWHMVRVKCSACGSTQGISYLALDGGSEAMKAECCEACKSYVKIFYLEKDTRLVPAADDLASLALDVLVDEAGYNRIGPNLLFAPGA